MAKMKRKNALISKKTLLAFFLFLLIKSNHKFSIYFNFNKSLDWNII
jgi:hypothetical protein